MRFTFSLRVDFARLCAVMLRGELLALRCSERQARLADSRLRRQLTAQQQHEYFHVRTFESILALLPHRHAAMDGRAFRLLDAFERKLDDALDCGDLEESLLGLQVILEGAAAAVLCQLDLSVQSGNAPLHPARCLLVAQEQGHQLLGESALASALKDSHMTERLQCAASEYAHMASETLAACSDTLGSFGVDVTAYSPLQVLCAPMRPRTAVGAPLDPSDIGGTERV